MSIEDQLQFAIKSSDRLSLEGFIVNSQLDFFSSRSNWSNLCTVYLVKLMYSFEFYHLPLYGVCKCSLTQLHLLNVWHALFLWCVIKNYSIEMMDSIQKKRLTVDMSHSTIHSIKVKVVRYFLSSDMCHFWKLEFSLCISN